MLSALSCHRVNITSRHQIQRHSGGMQYHVSMQYHVNMQYHVSITYVRIQYHNHIMTSKCSLIQLFIMPLLHNKYFIEFHRISGWPFIRQINPIF